MHIANVSIAPPAATSPLGAQVAEYRGRHKITDPLLGIGVVLIAVSTLGLVDGIRDVLESGASVSSLLFCPVLYALAAPLLWFWHRAAQQVVRLHQRGLTWCIGPRERARIAWGEFASLRAVRVLRNGLQSDFRIEIRTHSGKVITLHDTVRDVEDLYRDLTRAVPSACGS